MSNVWNWNKPRKSSKCCKPSKLSKPRSQRNKGIALMCGVTLSWKYRLWHSPHVNHKMFLVSSQEWTFLAFYACYSTWCFEEKNSASWVYVRWPFRFTWSSHSDYFSVHSVHVLLLSFFKKTFFVMLSTWYCTWCLMNFFQKKSTLAFTATSYSSLFSKLCTRFCRSSLFSFLVDCHTAVNSTPTIESCSDSCK